MANGTGLDGMLLASRDPERLREWYACALEPQEVSEVDHYRILTFRGFYLIIDSRDDIAATNPDPGRVILNFDVEDARAAVKRIEEAGTRWVAPLEDRDGSLMATATDPDGNYVQVIQLSEAHRAAM
ncbi:VOC family protein [Streptomonospora algeriensis]|uniref:VOC family protein n=1 Tax=Streptomonospora algeriensis TaxID=995084 RepID=A0ABW3BKT4_9ACTN